MCTVYLKYHNSHWLHFLHNAWPHPSGNHPHRDLSSNPQLLQIPSVLPGFSGSDPAFPTRRIPHTTSCCFPALHSRLFPPACQKMIVIHIRTHCIVRFFSCLQTGKILTCLCKPWMLGRTVVHCHINDQPDTFS